MDRKLPLSEIPYNLNIVLLPLSETFKGHDDKVIKLPLKEQLHGKVKKIPIAETAWDFKGLLIEENVIGLMKKPLTLIEDVRSRVLVKCELIDRNHIKLKWYGDEVPKVEIYKKLEIDEEFKELVGSYDWDVGECIIQIDSNSWNIKVIGANQTGESETLTIEEPSYYFVDTFLNVAMNEKVYDFDVDVVSEHHIDIDL